MRAPYRKRRVDLPPRFKQFKPAGVPARSLASITLTIDEYESLRLADYLGLDHQQSAERMNISRPTFSRLIEKARNKVAGAIIDGKTLIIEGGNIDFINNLFECPDCGSTFEISAEQYHKGCPECGSKNMQAVNYADARGRGRHRGKR